MPTIFKLDGIFSKLYSSLMKKVGGFDQTSVTDYLEREKVMKKSSSQRVHAFISRKNPKTFPHPTKSRRYRFRFRSELTSRPLLKTHRN